MLTTLNVEVPLTILFNVWGTTDRPVHILYNCSPFIRSPASPFTVMMQQTCFCIGKPILGKSLAEAVKLVPGHLFCTQLTKAYDPKCLQSLLTDHQFTQDQTV